MANKLHRAGIVGYLASFGVIPFLPQDRNSTDVLLALFVFQLMCVGIIWWATTKRECTPKKLEVSFLFWLPRIAVLGMLPWLSDDVYRYLWDGVVFAQGLNPFAHAPNELPDIIAAFPELYNLTDYKGVHTTYPPLAQLVFVIPGFAIIATKSWLVGLLVFKGILLSSEWIALRILRPSQKTLFWYCLCPLPVIEVAGQAHIDGLLLLPLAFILPSSIPALRARLLVLQGVALGSLALLKLYPAVVGLALLRDERSRTLGWAACGMGFAVFILGMVVFFHETSVVQSVVESLQSYSFELQFNGVVLYILKGLLMVLGVHEYWLVAPLVVNVLRMVGVLLIGLLVQSNNRQTLSRAMILLLIVTIALSTKVHPWYFVPLLFLNTIARYAWVWVMSALSLFTYAAYIGGEFQEQYALQYFLWACVVCVATLEWYFDRRRDKLT